MAFIWHVRREGPCLSLRSSANFKRDFDVNPCWLSHAPVAEHTVWSVASVTPQKEPIPGQYQIPKLFHGRLEPYSIPLQATCCSMVGFNIFAHGCKLHRQAAPDKTCLHIFHLPPTFRLGNILGACNWILRPSKILLELSNKARLSIHRDNADSSSYVVPTDSYTRLFPVVHSENLKPINIALAAASPSSSTPSPPLSCRLIHPENS